MSTVTKLLLPLALVAALSACSEQAGTPAPAAADAPPAAAADAQPAKAVDVASGTYTLDPTHTDVLVQWNHLGFSNPSAHFGQADGTLVYDAADVTKSHVEVTLPLSGLNSFTAKFDEHLRSADFFDAATFPSATFKSTKVEAAGTNRLTVTGDLTVKGVTRPVVLDVTVNGAGEHPMAKVPSVGFDATTTLKRSDFGMGGYAPAVSDELRVRITTEASIPKAG
ncbi:YceI family protein [Stenotrophomonas mori]|uniref:YceI family protein n=1 Tax=Stenotrophomonas mori TaxID=2871096 RepID=A0ABT0SII2_9GAMM|nr:YceI family protein [Stenotrophomonas mori]MCL7714921.1 YceI family protein [Stenotrophomonas mori]